jgi:hypothetical protein
LKLYTPRRGRLQAGNRPSPSGLEGPPRFRTAQSL